MGYKRTRVRIRPLMVRSFRQRSVSQPRCDRRKTRDHYAVLYARAGAIHDAFSGQFADFTKDGEDNKALFAKTGKLPMPLLAIGGNHSFGTLMSSDLADVASAAKGAVITNARALCPISPELLEVRCGSKAVLG
ncbi:hypothetical protein MA20_30830 [Bradyrhizobium japonicum]|uniref:Uncharacterized protein n=1 Tax=Bradyrhizobium japonicum TaxID=375 RepID=A0A0A3XNG2_BRAJP|nr:hypothetical protein [Bradyrhizobium japonicum]KGT75925.1 hypothetical protein MA20_30830 [Bradyrhizobium japonicum]MCS3897442.1 hypothetical protein [Bradyrhizobium japonicum USDA 38]MCS3949957.1 hypothetical protein [Bradyrhizobium japonicum]